MIPRVAQQLILLALLLSKANCLRVRGLEFPEHPERGKNIVLLCNYDLEEDGLYSVKWYRGDQEFFHFAPWQQEKKRAFRFPGIHVELKHSDRNKVMLRKLSFDSSGFYRCEVSGEGPSFDTDIAEKELRVIEIPKQPPRIIGAQDAYKPGEVLRVNCTSGPSKPAANLKWYINNDTAPEGFVREYLPIPVEDGLEQSVLGLQFIVRREHFVGPENRELVIACTATMATAYYRFAETIYLDDSQAAMVRGNAAATPMHSSGSSPMLPAIGMIVLAARFSAL